MIVTITVKGVPAGSTRAKARVTHPTIGNHEDMVTGTEEGGEVTVPVILRVAIAALVRVLLVVVVDKPVEVHLYALHVVAVVLIVVEAHQRPHQPAGPVIVAIVHVPVEVVLGQALDLQVQVTQMLAVQVLLKVMLILLQNTLKVANISHLG